MACPFAFRVAKFDQWLDFNRHARCSPFWWFAMTSLSIVFIFLCKTFFWFGVVNKVSHSEAWCHLRANIKQWTWNCLILSFAFYFCSVSSHILNVFFRISSFQFLEIDPFRLNHIRRKNTHWRKFLDIFSRLYSNKQIALSIATIAITLWEKSD